MLLSGRVGYIRGKYIREGTMQVKDSEFAHNVASIVAAISKVFPHAKDTHCVQAIARFCKVPSFVPARLVDQVLKMPGMVTRQAGLNQYNKMFSDVYNFQCRKRIPLDFLADEVARKLNGACPRTAKRK
jgi:hypothetical protein